MTNPPPAECLSMTQVKTILELYEQTCSYLRTVSEVGVSHNTVKKYLIRAQVSTANSYLQGVSTRKIQEIVSHLGIDQLSPASVSPVATGLDDQVQAFLLRPIKQTIPYLFVDASYYKRCAMAHAASPGRS